MPLPLLTALALCFLAANSLLTRAGVQGGTDPLAFAAIRVVAGAAVLTALALTVGPDRSLPLRGARRWGAAAALVVYLLGFSLAYRTLDAGLGALILFATVQLGLFALSLLRGERSGPARVAGMALALLGLVWLLLPGGGARADPGDAALMVAAGLGWAAYSFAGRFESRALAGSAGNFVAASAIIAGAAATAWLAGAGAATDAVTGAALDVGTRLAASVTPRGAALAVLSGGIASGIGYALLFRVLPRIGVATAGVAQLAVPVIAMAAGAVLLGEVPSARALAAAALVLAGIALATARGYSVSRSSGS